MNQHAPEVRAHAVARLERTLSRRQAPRAREPLAGAEAIGAGFAIGSVSGFAIGSVSGFAIG